MTGWGGRVGWDEMGWDGINETHSSTVHCSSLSWWDNINRYTLPRPHLHPSPALQTLPVMQNESHTPAAYTDTIPMLSYMVLLAPAKLPTLTFTYRWFFESFRPPPPTAAQRETTVTVPCILAQTPPPPPHRTRDTPDCIVSHSG